MQGFIHRIRCHPIHSYSLLKSAVTDVQSHLVRSSVPNIPIMAFLQVSGRPWHELLVVESTAHDCSKRSSGSLQINEKTDIEKDSKINSFMVFVMKIVKFVNLTCNQG